MNNRLSVFDQKVRGCLQRTTDKSLSDIQSEVRAELGFPLFGGPSLKEIKRSLRHLMRLRHVRMNRTSGEFPNDRMFALMPTDRWEIVTLVPDMSHKATLAR